MCSDQFASSLHKWFLQRLGPESEISRKSSSGYGDIAKTNLQEEVAWFLFLICDISRTTSLFCAKFRIQDPIFTRIMFKEMCQIDRSAFRPIFPTFLAILYYLLSGCARINLHCLFKNDSCKNRVLNPKFRANRSSGYGDIAKTNLQEEVGWLFF